MYADHLREVLNAIHIQEVWARARESAFLISSQVILMLLIWGPHSEWQEHGILKQQMSAEHGADKRKVFKKCALKMKVTQSYLTLCDLIDHTVHGILQARVLEWVASPFSRGSSQGSSPGLLHCRWILYQISHQGSPLVWFLRSFCLFVCILKHRQTKCYK